VVANLYYIAQQKLRYEIVKIDQEIHKNGCILT